MGTGSTFKAISGNTVRSLPMPLAPLNEQRRIVAAIEEHLSRLDAAVAALERVRATLQRYRTSVLQSACEGGLVRNASGRSQAAKHWARASLGDIASSTIVGMDRGRSSQRTEPPGSPYVKMNNVSMDGSVAFNEMVYVDTNSEELRKYEVREGDILFNTRNSVELVGKVGIVRRPPPNAVFNNNLMRIRLKPGIVPGFVVLQMCSPGFRRKLNAVKRATTNVAAVYAKDLLPLQVVLPPTEEQHAILAEVDRRLSLADAADRAVSAGLAKAKRLRQAILKRAFEGRLVPQDPNDEPASVLLERIRAGRAL
jgi:type I restriction enzyme S subunit